MFDWFGEKSFDYDQLKTIESDIIIVHKNFLTSLIMKAWVTCALDKNCIAPDGSKLDDCCGCHRYDQSALTIINGFFIGHSKNVSNVLPAYSFTRAESYFFDKRTNEHTS